MVSNALYYPYIKVPKNAWFTRVLLYWDKVGSIVPYEFIEDPDRLGSYMVSLLREELVKQVIPGMHLWQANNFDSAFIDYIDSKYGVHGEPYYSDWARIRREVIPTEEYNTPHDIEKWRKQLGKAMGGKEIHMEKLQGIAQKLCERGLATHSNPGDPYTQWYILEESIANDFMAYLAGVLGQINDDNDRYYPITEHRNGLASFVKPQGSVQLRRRFDIQQILLPRILPAPSEFIEPGRLRDFKERYGDELRRFRVSIEDNISALSTIENQKSMKLRLEDVTDRLRYESQEIVARMNEEKKWPNVDFATLCTVVGSGMATWKAVIEKDWRFGLTGALLTVAPAVYNAFKGSDLILDDKPLAYAALVEKKFSVAGRRYKS